MAGGFREGPAFGLASYLRFLLSGRMASALAMRASIVARRGERRRRSAYLGSGGDGDLLNGKVLAGVVLHPGEEDEGDARALARDRREDVFGAEGVLAGAGGELDDCV